MTQQMLELGQQYNREQVHGIFDPQGAFSAGAGTWGLQGIVAIPHRPGDFVFFVSYGQEQGNHAFDEGITEDGVLTWQSQPRNRLNTPVIQTLTQHDELLHSIHLFLRESTRGPYRYLGRLGYLSHDATREQPVHFQWQLLDWDALATTERPITLAPSSAPERPAPPAATLLVDAAPPSARPRAVDPPTFRSRKTPNYAAQDARNRALGLAGEKLAVQHEIARLKAAGRSDLADKVVHTAIVEGDGAGYDIHSYTVEGSPLYIEVKTTRGTAATDFFMSANERAFAEVHAANYVLYRLYDWDNASQSARAFLLPGTGFSTAVDAIPTKFRMRLK